MKNLLTILMLLLAVPVIAQTSFTREEGNGSLSPDKKWYVQIISGPSKIDKETAIGIYLYNVKGKKIKKDNVKIQEDDIPIFKVIYPALLGESARGTEIKWNDNGFDIVFIGIRRIFKYDILRKTFSLAYPKIKKDKTSN